MSTPWSPAATQYPLPPRNGQVTSSFLQGQLDLHWDDPKIIPENALYNILGVNIYRADVSDLGPYVRINSFPVSAQFYRDQTDNILITKEIVRWDTSWVAKGDLANNRRWAFQTAFPIVKQSSTAPFSTPTAANAPSDVELTIDGVVVPVSSVFGPTGEVTLINVPVTNPVTEREVAPIIPTATSVVTITYFTNRNHVRSGLDSKITYRITTVATDPANPTRLVETPLKYTQAFMNIAVETMDYIWREACRRNNWILEQGGERVKIFIRKLSGVRCFCSIDPHQHEYLQQPSNRCQICWGTGFVGGFEGPWEAIVAPDDAERRMSQSERGRRMEHTYEVWTGPSPLVTQRDFLVKQTNERYSIGPVRRPTNRGNVLQQHFNIAYLDEGDIRYKVPITGTASLPWPQTRQERDTTVLFPVIGTTYEPRQIGSPIATPEGTDKPGYPDEREQRGRTPTFENQNE